MASETHHAEQSGLFQQAKQKFSEAGEDLCSHLEVGTRYIPDQVLHAAYSPSQKHVAECKCPEEQFHLHFGAGRLGLGLVLPSIVKGGRRWAFVQRPSKDWKHLYEKAGEAKVTFQVNGKPIKEGVPVSSEKTGLDDSQHELVVLTQDTDFYRELVSRASSFSTALGPNIPKVMVPILQLLPDKPDGERPILYACENEHGPVSKLAEQVSKKVDVVTCMVDRICVDKKVEGDVLDCVAEEWEGSVVVLTPFKNPGVVPFGGNVTIPKSKDVANYFYQRKFSIVNGGHAQMAYLTLQRAGVSTKEGMNDHPLMKPNKEPADVKRKIDAMLGMRCVQLLDEVGIDVMKEAHGFSTNEEVFEELLRFCREVKDRVSSIDDNTGRIFGFGAEVDDTWNRLLPSWKYTQQHKWASTDTPMGQFLKHTDIDEAYADDTIQELTLWAVQFVSDDLQKLAHDTEEELTQGTQGNEGAESGAPGIVDKVKSVFDKVTGAVTASGTGTVKPAAPTA